MLKEENNPSAHLCAGEGVASLRPVAPDVLVTPRLRAERLRDDHFALLRDALYTDPRVMATLGGRTLREEEVREIVRQGAEHWAQHGFGTWIFFTGEDSRFVGRGGIHRYEINGANEAGLIYHIAADAWGYGFATEIAVAMLRLGFGTLALPSVASWTLPGNAASRRVMEKCGMRYERAGEFKGLLHVFYRITAAEWRDRQYPMQR